MAPSLFAAAFKSPRLGILRSTSSEGGSGGSGVLEVPLEQQQQQLQQDGAAGRQPSGGVPPLRLAGGERPAPAALGRPRETVTALPPPTAAAHGAMLDEVRA